MAKRSSRKSSSGDEALLWGIAAVVVAIVGVGTAIMLTRPGKAGPIGPKINTCEYVKCASGKNQGVNFWTKNKNECCKSDTPPAKMVCRKGPGFNNCSMVTSCSDATTREFCSEGGTDDNGQACCVWEQEPPKPAPPTPAPAATKNKKQRQKPSLPKPTAMCCATSTGMNTYDNNDPKNPPELQCRMAGPDKTSCGKLDPDCKWTIPAKKQMTKVGCILGKCCGGEDCNNYSDESVCRGKAAVSNSNCYWDQTGKCNTENFRMRRWRR